MRGSYAGWQRLDALFEYLVISTAASWVAVFVKVWLKRLRYPFMKSVMLGLALGFTGWCLVLIVNTAVPVLGRGSVAIIAFVYAYWLADSAMFKRYL